MRFITGTLALLFCAVLSLQGQPTNPAAAGTNTVGPVRTLSLQEAIRLALESNLNLQIARIEPQVSQFSLDGAYGLYDPSLTFGAQHSFRVSEGKPFNPTTGAAPVPATETTTDSVGPGLQGTLPSGLTYDITSDFTHTETPGEGLLMQDFNTHTADVGIALRQPLLKDFWIDADRLTIKVNKRNLKISELNLQLQIMTVVRDVEVGFYELMAARDNVKAAEKALELAQRLVSENRRKVEVGALPPLDEKQAESEAAVALSELIRAKREVTFRENILKSLITDNYEQWHATTIEPSERLLAVPQSYDLAESWLTAMKTRPDLSSQKVLLEVRELESSFTRNQLFPRLDVIGGYGRTGFDDVTDITSTDTLSDINRGVSPRNFIGAELVFPLTNRRARNDHKTAKARRIQEELRLKQLEQSIIVQVDDGIKLAQSNFQRVEATRQARLFAEAALDAEQKKLENGKSTSFVVLQLQRDLTNARFNEIRALADYNQSLSQLHFSEGTTLERNKVMVETK